MRKAIIILATTVLLFSCNSKKEATKTVEALVEKNQEIENEEVLEKSVEKEQTRFLVSFYSPGNGIDYKTKKEYDEFLAKEYPYLEVHQKSWGREGEVDYCVNIESLSKKNRILFISKSVEILNKSVKTRYNGSDSCDK